jgi:hypothetical protein
LKYQIAGKRGLKIVNLNRRISIHERCLNCSAWVYKEVSGCKFSDCSLYPFRTGKGGQNAKDRSRAIRSYCLWCMNGQRKEVRLCTSPDCPLFPYRFGSIDRLSKIKSISKNAYIEVGFEKKKEMEYLSIA